MSGRWQFYVEDRAWAGQKSLFMQVLRRNDGTGRSRRFGAAITYTPLEEGGEISDDSATLRQSRESFQDGEGDVDNFLQAALDAAWEMGMRPKGFADHIHELSAVRYHLEDMRALAKIPARAQRS